MPKVKKSKVAKRTPPIMDADAMLMESLLGSGAKKPKAQKSHSYPMLAGHETTVMNFITAHDEFKSAETTLATAKEEIVRIARPVYNETVPFSKTIGFDGEKDNPDYAGLRVTFADKFSELPMEMLPFIKEHDAEQFFTEKREITLLVTTDAQIKELALIMGADNFKRFFNIKRSLVPIQGMDAKQRDINEDVRELLKQAAPSVVPLPKKKEAKK